MNLFLKPFGLQFGPNTATSNRCTIGGMLGNNSSGTFSIKYGTTRDHVISIEAVLSDGTVVRLSEHADLSDESDLTISIKQYLNEIKADQYL